MVELGGAVKGFRKGQGVVVPFKVSCGTCPICSSGLTSQCEEYGSFDMYSGIGKHDIRGGMISDLLLVPNAQHMLIPIPDGLDLLHIGSASDNLPDAWCRVAPHLLDKPGQRVLVIGGSAKSIGLYAAAFAAKMDAEQVDYVDTSKERVEIAHKLGANGIQQSFLDHDGEYDLIVNASSHKKAIDYGIKHLRSGGVLTSVVIFMNKSIKIPYFRMYGRNLTFKTGLANPMADLPQMLAFIKEKEVRIDLVTTVLAEWENACVALLRSTTKVIVHRSPIL